MKIFKNRVNIFEPSQDVAKTSESLGRLHRCVLWNGCSKRKEEEEGRNIGRDDINNKDAATINIDCHTNLVDLKQKRKRGK
jgi:hypothetical protein